MNIAVHDPIPQITTPSATDQTGSAQIPVATTAGTKDRSFGPVHIVERNSEHTHTAVILHDRGCTGEEFAKEFFKSTLSDASSLSEKLPRCR
ncbi:hypothetical protein BDW02DRAFT_331181 [Decorospora gaudefroyi]|uniref:Uncharacterized protein n=1 Tax=Decorospora gaudefroyi TaxID=184978 RepID=A0A6A5KDT3_9PLEO|nr:hypothetical protein BDW02DRAFT_331181 [Decorospora gaudefroyi]